MKKKFPSLHLNADDFIPATNDEKESLVVMRDSVNFWADGMRRLRKNKIAMISLVFILIIMFFAYVMPAFGRIATSSRLSIARISNLLNTARQSRRA